MKKVVFEPSTILQKQYLTVSSEVRLTPRRNVTSNERMVIWVFVVSSALMTGLGFAAHPTFVRPFCSLHIPGLAQPFASAFFFFLRGKCAAYAALAAFGVASATEISIQTLLVKIQQQLEQLRDCTF